LKAHWVLVVMDQFTRRIIGFGVQAGDVDGLALCRMFNKAISGRGVPKYLSTDNDPLFTYHGWRTNLRILEIDELKAVPYTPISHPFVERLIGSLRRELLEQVFFWNTVDLERKLRSSQLYFNNFRTHASLDGETPAEIGGDIVTHPATLRNFTWGKHCGGLYELPVAA
jgi:transposase InsO family protein